MADVLSNTSSIGLKQGEKLDLGLQSLGDHLQGLGANSQMLELVSSCLRILLNKKKFSCLWDILTKHLGAGSWS